MISGYYSKRIYTGLIVSLLSLLTFGPFSASAVHDETEPVPPPGFTTADSPGFRGTIVTDGIREDLPPPSLINSHCTGNVLFYRYVDDNGIVYEGGSEDFENANCILHDTYIRGPILNGVRQFEGQDFGGSLPREITLEAEVNCATMTATLHGMFFRGTAQQGDTIAWFRWVNGRVINGIGSLATFPHFQTEHINYGTVDFLEYTAIIPYNNAGGHQYNAAAHATDGDTRTTDDFAREIPPQLCTIPAPDLSSFVLDPGNFVITVSQAQCAQDNTSFTMNIGFGLTTHTTDLTLLRADTGNAIAIFTHSQLQTIPASGSNHLHFESLYVAPGTYLAVGRLDATGVGATDIFYGTAFGVPVGTCLDALQDGTWFDITNRLNTVEGNLTEIIGEIDILVNTTINGTTLQTIVLATQSPIADVLIWFFWLALIAGIICLAEAFKEPIWYVIGILVCALAVMNVWGETELGIIFGGAALLFVARAFMLKQDNKEYEE